MARFLIVAIQGIASIVIARILSSSDYGLVSFGFVFINFLTQFSDFGLNSAIIQKKNASQSFLNTAFTIKNAVAFILVIISFVISFFVTSFYSYPHIDWIIRLLALNFVLNSIGFASLSLLRKEMNFIAPNIAQLISTIAGSATSVSLAYMGYGFWCLVWSNILFSAVHALSIIYFKPLKLHYEFNKTAAREMWRFGGYLFASALLMYALFNGATFTVGSILGPVVLGYFSLALDWGTKIPTILSQTVLNVLFPAFAKSKDNNEQLKNIIVQTIKYTTFISILANITLAFVSEDFLRIILGGGTDKWIPALTSFRILLVYGIARAVLEPLVSVSVALGETKVLFRANLLAVVPQITLLYPILLFYGITGIAWLILGSYSLQYVTYLRFLHKRANFNPLIFARSIATPIISVGSFFIAALLFNWLDLKMSLSITFLKAFFYAFLYVITFGIFTKFQFVHDLKLIHRWQ